MEENDTSIVEAETNHDKKSYAGIPEAEFVDDVESFVLKPENGGDVKKTIWKLDENHSKYKFMEYNLTRKRKCLRVQIPDLERSLDMIEQLKIQKKNDQELETEFLLSDQIFARAKVPPTDKVCLWLGANVMLEYSLEDAQELLMKNIEAAKKNLGFVEHDINFVRDQLTTTEVNIARVFNWNVKCRQAANKS